MEVFSRCVRWRGVQGVLSIALNGDLSFRPSKIPNTCIIGASSEQQKAHGFKVWYCPLTNPTSATRRRKLERTPAFECDSIGETEELVKHIRKSSNGASPPRVTAIINPRSGQGRAANLFTSLALPILQEAAGLQVTVHHTQRPQHATELVQQLNLDGCDILVMVGGDGTSWEALQGLLGRPDWQRAAQLPIATIPAGSGNGLAASCGLWDVVTASHAIVKGRRHDIDIASVLQQPSRRFYSFLSLSFGLMSNLDQGTNHLRWAGEARFTYGAVREILRARAYASHCWYLPPQPWQQPTADQGEAVSEEAVAPILPGSQPRSTSPSRSSVYCVEPDLMSLDNFPEGPPCALLSSLPGLPRKLEGTPPPGWKAAPSPLQHFMLVNPPYVATKFHYNAQGGLSTGYFNLDWVAGLSGLDGRLKGLSMLTKAESGEHVQLPWVQSDKVCALMFEPLSSDTWLMLDGEVIPNRTVYMEVHPGLCNVIVAP